jgi:exosortase
VAKGNGLSALEFHMLRPSTRNHIAYAILVMVSVLVCWNRLVALMIYAWENPSSSQILLIPAISLYLIWLARRRVFARISFSIVPGAAVLLIGMILFWLASWGSSHLPGNEPLCLSSLSVVILWTGGFLFCYGPGPLRAAAFPLLFLLLMIPFPDPVLNWNVHLLQQGSTEITYLIFRVVGIPVLRHGFFLSVPGVTIEVAKECSSIRSSMALVITCLLAAHLYLRTWWKALLLVLLSLPLSVIKNGIRIASLTLLSVYVDPSFLHGNLHRDGGFVFFFLALLMLWPVFTAFEKSDRRKIDSPPAALGPSEALERG